MNPRGLPDWWPDWRGETIVIVASGPSAALAPVEKLYGRCKIIAVNQSWELVPWADVVFAADYGWWKNSNGLPNFTGLKVSTDVGVNQENWNIAYLRSSRCDTRFLLTPPGVIGWGNSGWQAFNWSAQLQPARIGLVGFDMQDTRHWHPTDGSELRPEKVASWRKAMDAAAPIVAGLGIEVTNLSPSSALTKYPVRTIPEFLGEPCVTGGEAGSPQDERAPQDRS